MDKMNDDISDECNDPDNYLYTFHFTNIEPTPTLEILQRARLTNKYQAFIFIFGKYLHLYPLSIFQWIFPQLDLTTKEQANILKAINSFNFKSISNTTIKNENDYKMIFDKHTLTQNIYEYKINYNKETQSKISEVNQNNILAKIKNIPFPKSQSKQPTKQIVKYPNTPPHIKNDGLIFFKPDYNSELIDKKCPNSDDKTNNKNSLMKFFSNSSTESINKHVKCSSLSSKYAPQLPNKYKWKGKLMEENSIQFHPDLLKLGEINYIEDEKRCDLVTGPDDFIIAIYEENNIHVERYRPPTYLEGMSTLIMSQTFQREMDFNSTIMSGFADSDTKKDPVCAHSSGD